MERKKTAWEEADKDQKLSYSGFMIHGIFLALAVTFTEINTVLPAMVVQAGGAAIHIGILSTIMTGLPLVSQLMFSPFLQSRKRKKPFLLGGIYARMISFYLIGFLLLNSGLFNKALVLLLIYAGLIVFTLSGAFAGITYVTLIGTTIPDSLRKRFFLNKQVFWSIGVFISGILTRFIISAEKGLERYGFLFLAAASMLAAGSIGFWLIREKKDTGAAKEGILKVLGSMREILKTDHTFRNYTITANLLSSAIVMIPFYIPSFMKEYKISGDFIGVIVLLQIGGMVISNLIWPSAVRKAGFKGMLRIQSIMGFALPVAAAVMTAVGAGRVTMFIIIPLLGALAGAQKMSSEAVLVQISPDGKRALYSGIYGALNLTAALFPLLLAPALTFFGWKAVFPAAALLPLAALLSIRKMICPVDPEWRQTHPAGEL